MRVAASFRGQLFLVALLSLLAPLVHAAIDSFEFSSEDHAKRYHSLVEELRCPVCLSSNLAGSDSPISADLRREVYRLVEEGKSDDEIRDFMQTRYGDYILYRPRLTPFSFALYALPVVLIGAGVFVILRLVRRRAAAAAVPDADPQLNALLARYGSPVEAAGGAAADATSIVSTSTSTSTSSSERDDSGARATDQKGTPAS